MIVKADRCEAGSLRLAECHEGWKCETQPQRGERAVGGEQTKVLPGYG